MCALTTFGGYSLILGEYRVQCGLNVTGTMLLCVFVRACAYVRVYDSKRLRSFGNYFKYTSLRGCWIQFLRARLCSHLHVCEAVVSITSLMLFIVKR